MTYENALDIFDFTRTQIIACRIREKDVRLRIRGIGLPFGKKGRVILFLRDLHVEGVLPDGRLSLAGEEAKQLLRETLTRPAILFAVYGFTRNGDRYCFTADIGTPMGIAVADLSVSSLSVEIEDM